MLPIAILVVSVVFIVDAVIELCIIVEHVLSVDFFALIGEVENAFADEQVLNAIAFVERIRNMALSRVERSQDHAFCGVVLDDGVLGRLKFLLEERIVASLAIFLLLVVILEVTDNLLLFVLCKNFYLAYLLLRELHPWIDQDLLRSQSLVWICLQDSLQNAHGSIGDIAWLAPTALYIYYLVLKLSHVRRFERHSSK